MTNRERVGRAGSRLDEWVHPSIQRAVITAVMLAMLGKMGLDVSSVESVVATVKGQSSTNAVTLAAIGQTITAALERDRAERKRSWTITNDLLEIKKELALIREDMKR